MNNMILFTLMYYAYTTFALFDYCMYLQPDVEIHNGKHNAE